MGRPAKNSDYVSIVEQCYVPIERDEAWLAELLRTAAPVLDLGGGFGMSLVCEAPAARTIKLSGGRGRINDILQLSWPIIQQLDEEAYRKFYYPSRPVVLASSLVAELAQPLQQLFAQVMAQAGARDLLGMLGYPAPGWAFAMFVSVAERPISSRLRETLRRLRIHVEAGLRLRMFASSDAVAVIVVRDGRLEHVTNELPDRAAHEQLSAQTAAIEHARSARGRSEPHRALSVWHALVEGRWSLVEKLESDGRRYYHAFENAPHVQEHRALTDTEALVLDLSLRGLSGKEVSYATGLSQSRISAGLATAAERLGFATREELLRAGASFVGPQTGVSCSAELTHAEREVLQLVREGLSNRAIAEARGTAVNTVANQVASLLRKTGVGSRRALMVKPAPDT